MPEYLAPGVFVEEVSFRSKSIEGVSTTTTGFIGPTRFGPVKDTPDVITSSGEFERARGDGRQLKFGTDGALADNYVWHAARAFFEEGGKRLYVTRVFRPLAGSYPTDLSAAALKVGETGLFQDGHGRLAVGQDDKAFRAVARYPGAVGNLRVQLTLKAGPNVLGAATDPDDPNKVIPTTKNLREGDVVWIRSPKHFPDDLTDGVNAPPKRGLTDLPLFIAKKDGAEWTFVGHGLPPFTSNVGHVLHETFGAEAGVRRAEDRVNAAAALVETKTREAAAATSKDAAAKLAETEATAAEQAAQTAVTAAEGRVPAGEDPNTNAAVIAARNAKAKATEAATVATARAAAAGEALGKATAALTAAKAAAQTRSNELAAARTALAGKQAELAQVAANNSRDVNLKLSALEVDSGPGGGAAIRPVSLGIEVLGADAQNFGTFSELPLDPSHKTGATPDSIFDLFADGPLGKSTPLVLFKDGLKTGEDLLVALDDLPGGFELTNKEWSTAGAKGLLAALEGKLERGLTRVAQLAGANDGEMPGLTEYQGTAEPALDYRTGFKQLEDLEDISIVAAPGSNWNYSSRVDDSNAITNLLMTHATSMKYRIAIVDPPKGQSIADVRKLRAKLDSKHAALYYPWVTVVDPITRLVVELPPSGFVAGIYARNDIERGVWKAPANEVVRGAIAFETLINTAQQEVLNPEGINCFRSFEGRGLRLWGARTLSSDPEWKYVNLRRYFAYLERSVDKGTQWAVFEPNGEGLWANVRATIRDFLTNEWANGALLGEKPDKAFFVRCDRSTMTQNDLDNGRLVCLVGVAPLKPAEFVIFRIGQWTADQKN